MTQELQQPFKESKTLVKFSYGTEVVSVTTWKSPIDLFGVRYDSEPGVSIDMPTQTGGLNEDPLKVEIPLTRSKVNSRLQSLAALLASTRALPKMRVDVYNLISVGQTQKLRYLYEGTMERSRTNPEGRAGIVAMEFASELRYGLDRISLGRRSDPECDLIFGDNGCQHAAGKAGQLFAASYIIAGSGFAQPMYYPNQIPITAKGVASGWVDVSVDPVNSRQVSLSLNSASHPTPSPAPADPEWRSKTLSEMEDGYWIGSFLHDKNGSGLTIPIQSWNSGSNVFTLAQTPPVGWDGSVKLLQIGCPHTILGCLQRFNTMSFGGLGYGTPAYNPTLEVAP